MGGGLPNLLQYYIEVGASRDPKYVLRNIWMAPNDYDDVEGHSYLICDGDGDENGDVEDPHLISE